PEYTESVLTSSAGPTLAPWREWLQQSEIVGASCPAPQLVRVVVERFRHVDPALAGLRGLALDDRQCCRAGKAGELGGGSGIGNPQRNAPLPDQGEDPSVAPERLEPEHALLLHQPQPVRGVEQDGHQIGIERHWSRIHGSGVSQEKMANNLLECPPIGSRSGERPRKESATLSELRSEERRVGKECRSRGAAEH